jgi:hypothetical protein
VSWLHPWESDTRDTRLRAVKTAAGDPGELARIATTATHADAQLAAMSSITDQDFLKQAALQDKDWHVREAAVKRVTDRDFLRRAALRDADRDVRRAALLRADYRWRH